MLFESSLNLCTIDFDIMCEIKIVYKKNELDKPQLSYVRIAFRYFCNSSLTFGYKKNKPIIFGKTSARIMASEKVQTADMSPAAPITINNRNKIL